MSLEQYKDSNRAELWNILQIQVQVLEEEIRKNAELEKERDIALIIAEQRSQFIINLEELGYISVPEPEDGQAYHVFRQCSLDNYSALQAHNLEQQANALDTLHKEIEGGGSSSLMTFILKEEADNLRNQAKAIKESK